jgi:hypothetical protein
VASVLSGDLTGYADLLIVFSGVTASVAGWRVARVSVDAGASYFSTLGDYVSMDDNGVTSTETAAFGHSTSTTAARSGTIYMPGISQALPARPAFTPARTSKLTHFVASSLPINKVQVLNPNGGNLTAGKVWIFARSAVGGYEAGPPATPLVAAMSWQNQGTSTAVDATGGGVLLSPQVDGNVHGLLQTAPAAPFDVYLRSEIMTLSSAASSTGWVGQTGILLKDGPNGDFYNYLIDDRRIALATAGIGQWATGLDYWTNATTYSTTPYFRMGAHPYKWLRVNVTSTTMTFYVSHNGRHWIQVYSEALATRIGAVTQIGFSAKADTNNTALHALISYFGTTAPS